MEQNIKVTITVDKVFKTAFYALGIYSTVKFISKLSNLEVVKLLIFIIITVSAVYGKIEMQKKGSKSA